MILFFRLVGKVVRCLTCRSESRLNRLVPHDNPRFLGVRTTAAARRQSPARRCVPRCCRSVSSAENIDLLLRRDVCLLHTT